MTQVSINGVSCTALAPVLTALVDGELPLDQRTPVERHVATCSACAGIVAQQRAAQAAVRSAARMQAPAALRARVLADLDRLEPVPLSRRRLMVVGAVAAVLTLFTVAGLLRSIQGSHDSPLVDRAIDSHLTRTMGSTPVMVRNADAGAVAAWLQTATGRTVEVPQFGDDGYRLVGARTEPSVAQGAVSLVYQGDDRLTCIVIAGRMPLGAEFVTSSLSPDVFVARRRGVTVAAWEDGDATYLLIGALDPAVVERLARSAESQE